MLLIIFRYSLPAVFCGILFVGVLVCGPGHNSIADDKKQADEQDFANVLSVKVSGKAEAYQFSVEINSPDTGCEQYTDWWEVVSNDGKLLYRRILLHSHVNEQPFVRSGGPIEIASDTVVWIRAHMNTTGYGGTLYKGSVMDGFQEAEAKADFAADLEKESPLPKGCAF